MGAIKAGAEASQLFATLGDAMRGAAAEQLSHKARNFDPSVRSGLFSPLKPGTGTCASGEDDPTPTLLRGHKASLVYDEKAEHNGGKIAESVRHEEECDKVGKGKGTFKGGCKGKGKGSQRDTAQLADVVEVEANDKGGRTV